MGTTTLHFQEWGRGEPVIALHPLALESTAFAGVARLLADQGLRTLAVDLPGFGLTPLPEDALTPARLAAPVIELARSLETPPLLLGMSMGGRVALEAVLTDPEAFRGVVLVAPYLPWRRGRQLMGLASWLNPAWGNRLPLEWAWPALKLVAETIESVPRLEHDWLARACVRVIYYTSCAATRVSMLSAARELALDPAFGPEGLWTRLPLIAMPTSFVWAGRDRLIPPDHARHVANVLPSASQIEVPCSGHFVNGTHFRCMERAIARAVERTYAESHGRGHGATRTLARCIAGVAPSDFDPATEHAEGEAPEPELRAQGSTS